LTNSINRMKIAGVALAVAICATGSEANAQLRVFMGPGGSANQQAPGSAGMGTSSLGLGGFGSATENLAPPAPDAGQGLSLGANNALGVASGAAGGGVGASQGSLSSAVDRPSSPINSVTNSLMGPVSNAISRTPHAATTPAGGKRKKSGDAAAAPSSDRGSAVASKVSPARNP
jgi:hypothetical protein